MEEQRNAHRAAMEEQRNARRAAMEEQRNARRAEMEEQRDAGWVSMESMDAQRPMQGQRSMTEHQLAMQKYRDQQRALYEKQQQEREAQAVKWREAKQKRIEERMNTYLKQREERLLSTVKQQEAMRNRAEDRHNYMVENRDDILKGMLDEQVEIASRHEELRKQAEERRKKMAVMRATMMDMAPEERMAYIEEHREGLFGELDTPQRPAGRPAPPPWMQNSMRPPVPPAAPGR
jgi:hypothetical protein